MRFIDFSLFKQKCKSPKSFAYFYNLIAATLTANYATFNLMKLLYGVNLGVNLFSINV